MKGEVIFASTTKILVKTEKEVVLLIPSEITKNIKYKNLITFEGEVSQAIHERKKQLVCNPTEVIIVGQAWPEKQSNIADRETKSPEERFAEIEKFLQPDSSPDEKKKYLPLAHVLAKQSSSIAEKLKNLLQTKTVKKQNWSISKDQSKFLIPIKGAQNFSKDQIIERFGRLIQISHVGKKFQFKSNKAVKGFSNGDEVCYVYYFKKEPIFNADEFLQATKDYYAFIAFVKKNGIKPRHKSSEVAEIKKAKVYCDSRTKIEGNSWIATNKEYLWYVTHKLSPITIDNNIKINNQFAQCWRIPLHQVMNKLDELEQIDIVLFKSSAIPNAQDDDNELEVI